MSASRSTRTTRQRPPAAATTSAPSSLDGDATAIAAAAVVAPVPHAPSAPTTAPSTDASSSSSDGMQCDPEEGPRLSAKEKGKGRDPAANDEPVAAAAPVTAGGSSNPRPTPRPPRRATKCNACYKPITEGQKQYEAKHRMCSTLFRFADEKSALTSSVPSQLPAITPGTSSATASSTSLCLGR